MHFDTDAGICVINANQAGNATFAPAPQVQQSFAVVPNAQGDAYNAVGNVFVDSSTTTPFTVIVNDVFPAGTTIFNDFPKLSANGGNVTMVTAAGPTMGQFTYNPPVGFTGSDTFTYTLIRNSQSRQATVTFTVADNVWFINNNAGACPSHLRRPCRPTRSRPSRPSRPSTRAATAPAPTDNDKIFVYSSATSYTTGTTALILRNGQRLVGQGITGSTETRLNVPLRPGQVLPTNNLTAPTLTNGTPGIVVTTGQNNFVHGLVLGNGATALSGNTFGTLTINDNVTINTNGAGINLQTGTLSGSLVGVTSTSATVNNVSLVSVATSGTFDLGTGALSGASSSAFVINDGAGSFSYAGTITNASATRSVSISNKDGGTVTLSGNINPAGAGAGIAVTSNSTGANVIRFTGSQKKISTTGASAAVDLSTNTGATISFENGGLEITKASGAGAGFSATGGATAVTVEGTGNTINTTGGPALNVASTTIGANGLTFRSLSASGGANGIVLSSTGSSGGLTVTGDGTGVANGSGGTIQNTTERGRQPHHRPERLAHPAQHQQHRQSRIEHQLGHQLHLPGRHGDSAGNGNDEQGINILNLFGTTNLIEDVTLDRHHRGRDPGPPEHHRRRNMDMLTIRRLDRPEPQGGIR